MLTEAQTDAAVLDLQTRATAAGWPSHAGEVSRGWLQRGAAVVHVGREVIALRTWTGAILRRSRDGNSEDGTRRANEEFYGLVGEPVVDEAMRLVAQTGEGSHDESVFRTNVCPEHGNVQTIGCQVCGTPVIERVVMCGCPRPLPWIRDERGDHPNIRAITGQIDHASWCPGYKATVETRRDPVPVAPTEIVRPKRQAKREVVSLPLKIG